MKKSTSATMASVILVSAFIALLATLAALLLVGYTWYQQQQVEMPFLLTYPLLFILSLAAAASLAVVVKSSERLLLRGSETDKARSTPAPPGPGGDPARPDSLAPRLARTPSLDDGRWMKLVEECVEVLDELDDHMSHFDEPRREVAKHVVLRLEEILERSGVEVIENERSFDRARHKPASASAITVPGVPISETLSPGFAVGPRVLRRARVRVEGISETGASNQ